jgi:ubiquitin conjugation factor E4 B
MNLYGSHTQFYDKFNIHHNIAELLEYLWQVPSHHKAWIRVAQIHEKGVYVNFLNFLINDSILLLDESLNKIPELKTMETEMAEWEQRPSQERQEIFVNNILHCPCFEDKTFFKEGGNVMNINNINV